MFSQRGQGRSPDSSSMPAASFHEDDDFYTEDEPSSETVGIGHGERVERHDVLPFRKGKRGRPKKYPRANDGDADSDVSIDGKSDPSSSKNAKTLQKITDDDLHDWQQKLAVDDLHTAAPAVPKRSRADEDDDAADADYVEPKRKKKPDVVDKLTKLKGKTEYEALNTEQRRDIIVAYFEGAGNKDMKQTHAYFVLERGWPGQAVSYYVKKHVNPNYASFNSKRKFDHDAIKIYYREAVAAAGNDPSKVSITLLAKALGVGDHAFRHVVNSDEELRKQIDAAALVKDLSIEAHRSLVVAYFIANTKGNYRERKNACVRYFTRVLPFMQQKTILEYVDRFVKTGSVRNIDRNRKLHWEVHGKCIKYGFSELDADELQYLENVRTLQEQVEKGLENHLTTRATHRATGDKEVIQTVENLQMMLSGKCDRIAALERALDACRDSGSACRCLAHDVVESGQV